ncbi:porin [Motilimonas sp. 1_MG-2023]|uniref:porin n=1 Tax=Motilimonas TaxID=1914248 RepID=UPI0026E41298|nr:porin [Motilimonas sp. 1_MG-2023]MDO6524733.1 porin [Motilimonas sp. 1_MG-2023]
MKKTLLTSAILAALASGSVSAAEVYKDETHKVDVYGKIQGMYYDSKDKGEEGDQSYFRLGVKAKSAITESAYAFGRFEVEYAANTSDDLDVRLGYAGLGDKQFGALSYGRQYGAYTLVSDFTDVLYEFGGDASGTGTDHFGTGKADSLLKYSVEFGGATFEANYQLDNTKEEKESGINDTATSYGLSATYGFDFGVNIGAAYNNGERLTVGAGDAEMTAIAINYDANGVYAALLYSFGENWGKSATTINNTDFTAFEAALGYDFANGFGVLAGYNKQEAEAGNVSTDTVDYYTLGARYQYNKQFQVGVEYKADQIKGNEDVVALAAVYKF